MEHLAREIEPALRRIGIHHPGDTDSFSLADARGCARSMTKMNVDWLALRSPSSRAIPEEFIRGLARHGIHILMQFGKMPVDGIDLSEIQTLLEVYGKWGLEYACLFEKPNMKPSWGDELWVRNNIVEEHTRLFLEFSHICVENNIKPVFSPLFPAGDYWDLAFLENSFRIIKDKAPQQILDDLVIAAYGWHFCHPHDWGAGAKARWPHVVPFSANAGQDQRGFRAFEWYSEIGHKVFSEKKPVIILEAGQPGSVQRCEDSQVFDWSLETDQVKKLLAGENVFDEQGAGHLFPPIGKEVLACFFRDSGANLEKIENLALSQSASPHDEALSPNQSSETSVRDRSGQQAYASNRYIYIDQPLRLHTPRILQQLDQYIKEHKPYVGFSLVEGIKAPYLVAITEDKQRFSDEYQSMLSAANIVKVISLSELNTLEI